MGLSIHYSGSIKDAHLIPALVEEVKDICSALNWKCTITDPISVSGIVFSPPDCEPLFLNFLQDRQLYSPVLKQFLIEPATTISVKTQYAGIEAHKAIISLLTYLSSKYFDIFHLHDEGGYWDTNDEEILKQQFNNYEVLLDNTTAVLHQLEPGKNETPDSLAQRIYRLLNRSNDSDK